MPQITIKGLTDKQMRAISTPLIPKLAEAAGFVEYRRGMALPAGTKVLAGSWPVWATVSMMYWRSTSIAKARRMALACSTVLPSNSGLLTLKLT